MTWFRIDDQMAFHSKIIAVGNEAVGAWVRAGAWCSAQLTDGVFDWCVARQIAKKRTWDRLISVGLVEEFGAKQLQIHDFLKYNPSAEDVRLERSRKAQSMSALRASRKASQESNVTGNKSATLPVTGLELPPPVTVPRPDPVPSQSEIPPIGPPNGGRPPAAEDFSAKVEPAPFALKSDTPAASRKVRPHRKPETLYPDDFSPSQANVERAKAIGADIDREVLKFAARHRSQQSLMRDWQQAFTTWLLRAEEMGVRRPSGPVAQANNGSYESSVDRANREELARRRAEMAKR